MKIRKQLLTLTLLGLLAFPGFAQAATHTVAPGDTLYLLAQRYGTQVQTLKSTNQLKSDMLVPGQKLQIPDHFYKVQQGESPYLIGKKLGIPYQEILRANGLSATATIYPGQTLRIPATQGNTSRGAAVDRTPANYSAEDLELLARLITAEADSESYQTKVAVGAVVLNRVKSNLFPNSIAGVVYQVENGHYQFEPVLNGWINVKASPDAIRAAKEALSGVDPTKGALYFFESWVPNKFLQARPVSMVRDSFTFSY